MAFREFLRIVAVHKGKVRAPEFKLRPGETGLSLFAKVADPSPSEIVDAVRNAGKRGDLEAVEFTEEQLHSLGLVLCKTPGGTGNAEINELHYEARLPWYWRLWLSLRGIRVYDYFNDHYSVKLHQLAKLAP